MDEPRPNSEPGLDAERYAEAFQAFWEHAQEGNALAEGNLGVMYSLGLGTSRDVVQAIYWLKRAAAQGYGPAAHNLATLYVTGEPDLPIDGASARKYYLLAYDLGFRPTDEVFYSNLRE